MDSWQHARDVIQGSLVPTLANFPQLSTVISYINNSTTFYDLINVQHISNFTFLAPTNDAIATWVAGQGNSTPPHDVIEAMLAYHLLNGSWPTIDFTPASQFAPTSLTNASYANVTVSPAGQRVETVEVGSNMQFLSNNKTASTITTRDVVFLGGLFHIIDTVLSIPTLLVLLAAQANWSFFVAILNQAQFLSVGDAGTIDFVNHITRTPNMTFLLPNTQFALDTFKNSTPGISSDDLLAILNYHIIPEFVLYTPDMVNGTQYVTAQGDNVTITRSGTDIFINRAKILQSDYLIANGVAHTLDLLLNSSDPSIPPQPQAVTNVTTPSPSSTPTSSPSSGLSTGAKVAIGVTIPIVVIAAALILAVWLFRKRKGAAVTRQHEMDATEERRRAEELSGKPAAKELQAGGTPAAKELYASDPAHEMPVPAYSAPPAEME